jgi:phosphoribosyl-dephospho-CoA transferase
MLRERAAMAVHALLRIDDVDALLWEGLAPAWAGASLQLAPWVVVRRLAHRPSELPVGIRGVLRRQRAAAWLADRAVKDCITPQQLACQRAWHRATGRHPGRRAHPAFQVLDEVAEILAALGFSGRWGPGGSVGFELASGLSCTTPDSDLDLVLQAEEPIARASAATLHADLSKLPVRVDLLLETPHGAVALSEYVGSSEVTLLRCADGPRLVRDPWTADQAAASIA